MLMWGNKSFCKEKKMSENKSNPWSRRQKYLVGAAIVLLAVFATFRIWTATEVRPEKKLTSSMSISLTDQMKDAVRLSSIDWASIPLRVGTEGAGIYHRPFCPHAQRALEIHGPSMRIDFWTRQEVAASNRDPDHICQAGIFDCSIDPLTFLDAGDEPYCGIHLRRSSLILDFTEIPEDYVLCDVTSYMAVWVPPGNCSVGNIIVAERIPHNVVSGIARTADGVFTSGEPTSAQDTTFTLVFDQTFLDGNPVPDNNYNYFCDAHPNLETNGYVTVDVSLAQNPDPYIVNVKDLFFDPNELIIAIGDTVQWVWESNDIPMVLSALNMIENGGMGDATGDANCTPTDYPFFHVCFGDDGIPATLSCQRVFDWDEDEDVDLSDFENFVAALGTGNETWMAENWPAASFNRGQEIPLRVGTEGANLYHKPDCPAVLNSWNIYGIQSRRDFYTWEQIDNTGRVPDTDVCMANEGAPWFVSEQTAGGGGE